jgi:hypothetical protein
LCFAPRRNSDSGRPGSQTPGPEIGLFSVLHTWNQQLLHHPHVHCVIPAGGLAPDHSRWIPAQNNFFLPVKVLSRVFRGKFVAALRTLYADHKLGFHGSLASLESPKAFDALLRGLFRTDWVVYSKRPFGGAEHALRYLGCYTHRVAISNHRLVSLENGQVTFRWRNSAHKNKKRLRTLSVEEFLRRFLLHVLPLRFVRIRHFGFSAHRRRATLVPLCRRLLATESAVPVSPTSEPSRPLWLCGQCQGPMVLLERISPFSCAIFLNSNRSRLSGALLQVCSFVSSNACSEPKDLGSVAQLSPLLAGALLRPLDSLPPSDQDNNSTPIAPGFHNGFLQVAVSKTLRRSEMVRSRSIVAPGRFRYSTKTSHSLAAAVG